MFLFDINSVMITILGYPLSWLEFLGTFTGLICVWLTAKARPSSFLIGIVNNVFFFSLFFQVQLYADMFLQVVFAGLSVYGFIKWIKPKPIEADKRNELKISTISKNGWILLASVIAVGTLSWGYCMFHIHEWLPALFEKKAAFPFLDSFVAITSITACFIQARKKLEAWFLWITVDVICVFLYYSKGVTFMSIEYFIFLCICIFGLIGWIKEKKTYNITESK